MKSLNKVCVSVCVGISSARGHVHVGQIHRGGGLCLVAKFHGDYDHIYKFLQDNILLSLEIIT